MGWGIGFIFLTAAALMVARVLPALLALPLMATEMGGKTMAKGMATPIFRYSCPLYRSFHGFLYGVF